ncbi:MAG: hypothetical protein ABIA21_00065 [Candidatus Aenigmatarchaeota archaeon]
MVQVQHNWHTGLFVAFIVLLIAAGTIYFFNYDILIPGDPGSLKVAVGVFFIIPVVTLLLVQTLVASSLIHLITIVRANEKRDYLKALTISSVLVFMFSLAYLIFPAVGPFHYMIFPVTLGPSVLLIEAALTLLTIFLVTLLIRKSYSMSWRLSLLTAAFLLAMIMAIAS